MPGQVEIENARAHLLGTSLIPVQRGKGVALTKISKLEKQKLQIQATQFVFGLHPETLLPIDIVAPAIGKKASTFRSDVNRRPADLPRLTRPNKKRKARIFVRVADLMEFIKRDADLMPTASTRARKIRSNGVSGGEV